MKRVGLSVLCAIMALLTVTSAALYAAMRPTENKYRAVKTLRQEVFAEFGAKN